MNLDSSVFVHEKAICESDQIGADTRIWAFSHILPGVVIGSGCNISDYVFLETGCNCVVDDQRKGLRSLDPI